MRVPKEASELSREVWAEIEAKVKGLHAVSEEGHPLRARVNFRWLDWLYPAELLGDINHPVCVECGATTFKLWEGDPNSWNLEPARAEPDEEEGDPGEPHRAYWDSHDGEGYGDLTLHCECGAIYDVSDVTHNWDWY